MRNDGLGRQVEAWSWDAVESGEILLGGHGEENCRTGQSNGGRTVSSTTTLMRPAYSLCVESGALLAVDPPPWSAYRELAPGLLTTREGPGGTSQAHEVCYPTPAICAL